MSYIDEILKERAECTPEQGYNIVEIDDWAPIGEKLTIIKYVTTEAEALQYIQATGQELYYYGKRDAVDHIESEQYLATGSKVDSQPSMHNEEGWVGSKSIPEWKYEPETRKPFVKETEEEDKQEAEKRKSWLKKLSAWLLLIGGINLEDILSQPELLLNARYVYTGHESPEICEGFHGKTFNLLETLNRPVPPSEGLGYTNTHPNCKCYWEFDDLKRPKKLKKVEKLHIEEVHKHIEQSAKDHTLHTVHTDGTLSNRTRGTNPMRETQLIRETLDNLHRSFNWMTPDYLSRIKSISPQVGGRFMLIRASAETITDHRSEGEPLRRLLAGDEIHAFGRTGIGKGSDINHLGTAFQTGGTVMDAEYDPIKRELQFLHHEKDPEIIAAIQRGDIGEVSINAGTPRTMTVEVCDPVTGERCVTPRGLILGELDNIAFTYVVSSPVGMMWRGQVIPKAKAGVKNTALELL